MGEFVKDNDQQPLFFHHGRKYIFFHTLLENSAKIFLSKQFSNMAGGGKNASEQSSKGGSIMPYSCPFSIDELPAFFYQHDRNSICVFHLFFLSCCSKIHLSHLNYKYSAIF